MFIDLFSSNTPLPILWPCALPPIAWRQAPHQGLDVLQGPGGTGPRGHTTLTHGTPPLMCGPLIVNQCLTQSLLLGDAGMCCISPHTCGMRCAEPACPHKPLLWPCTVDTQPGRVELQGWPVPQGTTAPSGQGDCVVRTTSEALGAS
jgi:hypothetical protein